MPRSVLISGIGALVLLVSVFFNWYTASVSISGGGAGSPFGALNRSASVSGWDATDVAKLVFLLALIAVAAWAIELFVPDVTLPVPAWMIAGAAGALSALLVLFRILSKPGGAHDVNINLPTAQIHADISTSWGIWLALIAALATVAGAYLRMNEPA